jgi:hypothetical protein
MHICYACGAVLGKLGIVIYLKTATEPRPVYQCLECYDRTPERLCCQHAGERGYRRGYGDGYQYAVTDLWQALRSPRTLVRQINHFTQAYLGPWITRASYWSDAPIEREHGPRMHTQHAKKTA